MTWNTGGYYRLKEVHAVCGPCLESYSNRTTIRRHFWHNLGNVTVDWMMQQNYGGFLLGV